MTARICLGEIAAAHGIRGAVKVRFFGEDPMLLETSGPLFTSEQGPESLKMTIDGRQKDVLLVKIEGVTDRNRAETLRGTKLWIARERLPALKNDRQYYQADLIGLSVLDGNGDSLGKLIAVENFGAGDLLEIKPDDAPSFYLPFTRENVPHVDVAGGSVTVNIPEGLREP